ncbi:Transmembrane and coiled-coil domain-containing protein 1-like protein [Smittium culicis]|uniref:Transmembrane and coiled-coil domain-containing protein 1-like protein n=2 Tax=Smittium culicis TaxID=133412 RepID=A0A1R1Y9Z0_9FUNG|nr:Transmembrane and coiled-coil domain-containing protein 1-like protein [Smittium culicis]OMJ23704.1 Transmembrane and coiled-coil domain-containing protein 1-like protein [Smittium culicis]
MLLLRDKMDAEDKDSSNNANKKKKRIEALKAQTKHINSQSATFQLRSAIVSVACQFFFMYIIGTIYENKPVARLPFTPLYFFQGITHRGLEGTDFTECSALFIYILTSMAIKPVLDAFFDFGLPKIDSAKPEWVSNPDKFLDKWLSK